MFGKKKKLGGMIGFLNLEDFWYSLTDEEQRILTPDGYPSPIEGEFSNPYCQPLGYFGMDMLWAIAAHNYVLADKMIHYGEQFVDSARLIDKHFFYLHAAECYYKQRDIRNDAYDLCEKYCLLDIALYEQFHDQMSEEWKSMQTRGGDFDGRIESYKRLAILYEKTNRYSDAIKICESALKFNQEDGTKGGFKARIEKLRKKC